MKKEDFCFTPHTYSAKVIGARYKGFNKHFEAGRSMETLSAADPKWMAILTEEVGEVAHDVCEAQAAGGEWTEAQRESVASELLDVLAVASAWLDAIYRPDQRIVDMEAAYAQHWSEKDA